MAALTPAQRVRRRWIESVIAAVAPALDLLLLAGDRVSRVAGRNQLDPEPPRRTLRTGRERTPIGGPPEQAG